MAKTKADVDPLLIRVRCEYLRGRSALINVGSAHGVGVGARVNTAGGWGVVRLVEKRGCIADFSCPFKAKQAEWGQLRVMICCQCGTPAPQSKKGCCAKCGWKPGARVGLR